MKQIYPIEILSNPLLVLRKAGYSAFRDPQTGDESFVVRLTAEFYPRFHLYVEHASKNVSLNLHLDQKKPSYGSGHAHGGEYEGSTIEREMERIDGWVKAIANEQHHEQQIDTSSDSKAANRLKTKKEPWWIRLFFGG